MRIRPRKLGGDGTWWTQMLDARLAGLAGEAATSRFVARCNLPLRVVGQPGQDAHLVPVHRHPFRQSGRVRRYAVDSGA